MMSILNFYKFKLKHDINKFKNMHKVAVLIASGSGMGADAAKILAKQGYKIAIMSSSGKGERLAKT